MSNKPPRVQPGPSMASCMGIAKDPVAKRYNGEPVDAEVEAEPKPDLMAEPPTPPEDIPPPEPAGDE